MKRLSCLSIVALVLFICSGAIAQPQPGQVLSKDEILAIAAGEVEGQGYSLEGVSVIYDDGNRLWEETVGKMTDLNSPNFGVFKRGFMKNYRTVYFDFKEPLPDLWVFIDKDTGEVLEVYTTQQ
jgi:hypothetical protein